jgi:4-amino-4-deoxy-L-arabinose transferase-like glycosyltransferase
MTFTVAAPGENDRQAQSPAKPHSPRLIFWTALLIRVLYVTLAHTWRVRVNEDHFGFGWEAGRIARSLVTGQGYANPFITGHTGPTAWLPPAYPLLIAAAFKLFGVYTPLSAWFLLTVNSLFSAATVPAIYEIADRCFNRRVAVWSAWLWALYPAAMQYAVRWIWEMSLTAMLFAWVLVIALRVRGIGDPADGSEPQAETQTMRRWLLFGVLWALIALSNPSLLLFLPVCGVWMLLGARRKPAAFGKAVLAGVVFLAGVAPWTWRNWTVFHALVPIRGNFGVELYIGNLPGSLGMGWGVSVTSQRDLQAYRELGEVRYVKEHAEMARAEIRSDPKRFIELSIRRFYFFWASVPHPVERSPMLEYVRDLDYCFLSLTGVLGLGLSLKRKAPGAVLFAWAFVLIPLTFYAVTVGARFRHPLEPLIAILTVYLFQSAERKRAQS